MTIEELRAVFLDEEEIEYHLMGMEKNADALPGPGWYRCLVDGIRPNGDVDISFTSPNLKWITATVLRKNLPIAFRKHRKQVHHA